MLIIFGARALNVSSTLGAQEAGDEKATVSYIFLTAVRGEVAFALAGVEGTLIVLLLSVLYF